MGNKQDFPYISSVKHMWLFPAFGDGLAEYQESGKKLKRLERARQRVQGRLEQVIAKAAELGLKLPD